ncbi:3-dehydroquinate synthase, partial [bacterium]|nr:3-dehydroquinate synthase [bacterium]
MKTTWIHASTPYPIYIGQQLLETALLADCCTQINKRLVIITDTNLVNSLGIQLQQQLQQQGLQALLLACPAGEIHKTRETKQQLEDELLARQYGRDTCLIALGGGVVTDLVGFLAATYCRGLPVIYVPTTLLAMVDASIGGKTGVNTPHGKNLIGTFTQPQAVFMDINTLNTLPENEWHNGMAEMIKHSLIADATIFKLLQQNVEKIIQRDAIFLIDMIHASCLIKKNIVEQDEQEQGLRQLLNFGHTIGHAIETIEHYRLSHGEAVAIG